MRDVFRYLRERYLLWGFYLAAAGLMLAVQYLGGQPMGLIWYTAGVLGFVLGIVLLFDGRRYVKRLRALRLIKNAPSALPAVLPPAVGAIERQYQALLAETLAREGAARMALEKSQEENLRYYTLWVHQIKTPIAAMRLVLRGGAGDVGVLRQELFKVERYAEMALQYVKLRDIASDLVIERCDLSRLVRDCVKKYGLLFVYKGLSVEVADDLCEVVSDAKWLGFIIEQALSNAVKYTHLGGVRIFMEEGRLIIEDSGIGIRAEDLPRVFEKGYTGYNGRMDTRASGIGLYLAKRVAGSLSIGLTAASPAPHPMAGGGPGTRITLAFPSADAFPFL